MTTQITVLGLNQVGASIGLALSGHKEQILRVGNDREIGIARQAEKMGAFDKIVINLHSAVQDADVVVLALPVDEIEPTLTTIAESLKRGVVVVDTSPVKVAVMESAERLLGAERYFVTLTPAINPSYLDESSSGVDAAHSDLFKNSVMVITSPRGTHAGAIQLATDLAVLVGGAPYFADPLEADGLTAASDTLPKLLAAALLNSVTTQPGWREGRKLAGKTFAHSTRPIDDLGETKVLGTAALMNRQNVLRVLDNLTASLQELRGLVDRQEGEALHEFLLQARENRNVWLNQRMKSEWDLAPTPTRETTVDILGRLVGWRRKEKKS